MYRKVAKKNEINKKKNKKKEIKRNKIFIRKCNSVLESSKMSPMFLIVNIKAFLSTKFIEYNIKTRRFTILSLTNNF